MAKLAMMVLLEDILMVQVPPEPLEFLVDESQPDPQPVNIRPDDGAAVRTTVVLAT